VALLVSIAAGANPMASQLAVMALTNLAHDEDARYIVLVWAAVMVHQMRSCLCDLQEWAYFDGSHLISRSSCWGPLNCRVFSLTALPRRWIAR
jgi:hypothetical protein